MVTVGSVSDMTFLSEFMFNAVWIQPINNIFGLNTSTVKLQIIVINLLQFAFPELFGWIIKAENLHSV